LPRNIPKLIWQKCPSRLGVEVPETVIPKLPARGNNTEPIRLLAVGRLHAVKDHAFRIRAMIREFQPDVAHIRSSYHHLSPSILWELRVQNVPVLYHLNDFKLLCPNYNFVSGGHACEMCKGGSFWQAFRARCYPGAAARATLVAEAYIHRWLGTYRKCVDLFLAPSRFVRDKFVEHGWDAALFEVLPHFQNIHAIGDPPNDGPILYFGRLSAEKGIDDLIRAMQRVPDIHLVVAGDGPQKNELERLTASLRLTNVEFVGHLGLKNETVVSRNHVLPFFRLLHTRLWGKRFWNLTLMADQLWRPILDHGVS
jgi:glycosyltransferase involved in cell wall biosynthesis